MAVYRRRGRGLQYYMDFTIRGVRVKESTGTSDRRVALRVEAVRRSKLEDQLQNGGERAEIIRITLKEAIDRTFEERWKHNKDKGEMVLPRAKLLIELLGDRELSEISEVLIEQMKSKLLSKGKAPATVNRYCSYLKTILHMAQKRWKVLDRVPYVPMMKETKGRIRALTQDEEIELLSRLRNHEYEPYRIMEEIVKVLLDTGMRVGELLALRGEDVNFTDRMIHIWVNKGDKPRSIPMTSRVFAAIPRRSGPVFPISQDLVSRAWDSVREKMGLADDPQFVPHALRHTCASRMVQRGVDLYTVKEILGHSTIKVTERYAHLCPANLRHAIDVLDKVEGDLGVSHRNSSIGGVPK